MASGTGAARTGLRGALARRAVLARRPRPEDASGPPARLLWAELASLWRGGAGAGKAPAEPARRPRPVMILPGFGSHPRRMRPLVEALAAAGHEVHEWGLGFNFGPTPDNFEFLMRRVGALARRKGEGVVLVGWSLGGLFAREIARRQPGAVAMVVSMGTPFSGNPRANNAWRAYEMITGHAVDAPPVECDFSVKPPVPTVALWSPRDGIVSPRAAKGWPGERDVAVSLRCTHLDFAGAPEVVAAVLRHVDFEDGDYPARTGT